MSKNESMKDDKVPPPDDELPALFRDDLPDTLTSDLLALAHLSDVEEEQPEEIAAGPVRKGRTRKVAKPYGKKTEEEKWNDEIKELDFRTKAWKPFRKPAKGPNN